MIENKIMDYSNEKWILLHKIPKEDILDFILKNDNLMQYFKNGIEKHNDKQ